MIDNNLIDQFRNDNCPSGINDNSEIYVENTVQSEISEDYKSGANNLQTLNSFECQVNIYSTPKLSVQNIHQTSNLR